MIFHRLRSPLCLLAVATVLVACEGRRTTGLIPTTPDSDVTSQRTTNNGYKVLYSFKGGKDGQWPASALVAMNGTLFGTTQFGGTGPCDYYGFSGCGAVFTIDSSGNERLLYSFKGGADGQGPAAGLIVQNGVLYGTTQFGGGSPYCYGSGTYGCGTFFSITAAGKEKVLHSFYGYEDALQPEAALTSLNGELYGTTGGGGKLGEGAVFAVNTSGKERVLHSFRGGADGFGPLGGLAALNGTLYGTTFGGGHFGAGVVFAVTPSGKEHTVRSFGGGRDGASPEATLFIRKTKLYGTTTAGGVECAPSSSYAPRCGTIFSMTTDGQERVLHAFKGGTDGTNPLGNLADADGKLYGTTFSGGVYSDGVVYVTTSNGKEQTLYSFSGKDGLNPMGGLTLYRDMLYGTTLRGGQYGAGAVFEIAP